MAERKLSVKLSAEARDYVRGMDEATQAAKKFADEQKRSFDQVQQSAQSFTDLQAKSNRAYAQMSAALGRGDEKAVRFWTDQLQELSPAVNRARQDFALFDKQVDLTQQRLAKEQGNLLANAFPVDGLQASFAQAAKGSIDPGKWGMSGLEYMNSWWDNYNRNVSTSSMLRAEEISRAAQSYGDLSRNTYAYEESLRQLSAAQERGNQLAIDHWQTAVQFDKARLDMSRMDGELFTYTPAQIARVSDSYQDLTRNTFAYQEAVRELNAAQQRGNQEAAEYWGQVERIAGAELNRSQVASEMYSAGRFSPAELDRVANSAKSLGHATSEYAEAVNRLNSAQQRGDEQSTAYWQAQVNTRGLQLDQVKMDASLYGSANLTDWAADNTRALTIAGTAMAAFGAATTKALVGSIGAANEWESAFTGVRKTVDASGPEFDRLEAGLRGLTNVMPATHTEIAGIAATAGQLGIAVDLILPFTETITRMAVATNLTATGAATAMGRFSNVMGITEYEKISSAVVHLGNNSAATESEIMLMAQRLAAAGRIADMSAADVLGLSAAAYSLGVRAEMGGTAFARIIMEVTKAVGSGSEKLDVFASTAKMTNEEFSALWNRDAAHGLIAIIQGMKDLDAEGRSAFDSLSDMGLGAIRVSQLLLSLAANTELLGRSVDLSREAFERGDAAIIESEIRFATVESRIQIAKNAFNDASITMGKAFAPAAAAVADAAAGIMQNFAALPPAVLGVGGALAGVTGIAATLGGSLLAVLPQVKAIRSAFHGLQGMAALPGASAGIKALSGALGGLVAAAPWAAAALAAVGIVAGTVGHQMKLAKERAAEWRALMDDDGEIETGSRDFANKIAKDYSNNSLLFSKAGIMVKDYAQILAEGEKELNKYTERWIELSQFLADNNWHQNAVGWVEQGWLAAEAREANALAASIPLVRQELEALRRAKADYDKEQALIAKEREEREVAIGLRGGFEQAARKAITELGYEGVDKALAMSLTIELDLDFDDDEFQTRLDAVKGEIAEVATEFAGLMMKVGSSFFDPSDLIGDKFKGVDAYFENLRKQAQDAAQWGANMDELAKRGLSQGNLAHLASLDKDGAPLVAALVKDLETGKRSIDDVNASLGVLDLTLASIGGTAYEWVVVASLEPKQVLDGIFEIEEQLSIVTGTVRIDSDGAKQEILEVSYMARDIDGNVVLYSDSGEVVATISEIEYAIANADGTIIISGENSEGQFAVLEVVELAKNNRDAILSLFADPEKATRVYEALIKEIIADKRAKIDLDMSDTSARNVWNALKNDILGTKFEIPVYLQAPSSAGSKTPKVSSLLNTPRAVGGPIPGFPTGGWLPGMPPSNPFEDNILGVNLAGMPVALVRSGEFVVTQPSAEYYGDLMWAINSRAIPRETLAALTGFASGGRLPGYASGGSFTHEVLLGDMIGKGGEVNRLIDQMAVLTEALDGASGEVASQLNSERAKLSEWLANAKVEYQAAAKAYEAAVVAHASTPSGGPWTGIGDNPFEYFIGEINKFSAATANRKDNLSGLERALDDFRKSIDAQKEQDRAEDYNAQLAKLTEAVIEAGKEGADKQAKAVADRNDFIAKGERDEQERVWKQLQDAATVAIEAAKAEYEEAKSREEKITELLMGHRAWRGTIAAQAQGSLSGAQAHTDSIRSLAQTSNLGLSDESKAFLNNLANSHEHAFTLLHGSLDRLRDAMDKAAQRVSELTSIRDSAAQSISGGWSLMDPERHERENYKPPAPRYEKDTILHTANDGYSIFTWEQQVDRLLPPTPEEAAKAAWYAAGPTGIVERATAFAAKVQTFAAKIQELQSRGFCGAILRDLAAVGVEDGIACADELLALADADVGTLNQAYADIDEWAKMAGQYVTEGFYEGGLLAAEALLDGLRAEEDGVLDAIAVLAQNGADIMVEILANGSADAADVMARDFVANVLANADRAYEAGQALANAALTGLNNTLGAAAAANPNGVSVEGGNSIVVNVTANNPQAVPTTTTVNSALNTAALIGLM